MAMRGLRCLCGWLSPQVPAVLPSRVTLTCASNPAAFGPTGGALLSLVVFSCRRGRKVLGLSVQHLSSCAPGPLEVLGLSLQDLSDLSDTPVEEHRWQCEGCSAFAAGSRRKCPQCFRPGLR